MKGQNLKIYHYFNRDKYKFEEVEIEIKLDKNTVKLKNKVGLYSKSLIYKDKNKLYMDMIKNRYNHGIRNFSSNFDIEQEYTDKMLDNIFDFYYIKKNFEYIVNNFLSEIDIAKEWEYRLKKHVVIFNDVMHQLHQTIDYDNSDEDYEYIKRLNIYLSSAKSFIKDKEIQKIYDTPFINYQKLYNKTGFNVPRFYESYGMTVDNYNADWIEKNSKRKKTKDNSKIRTKRKF